MVDTSATVNGAVPLPGCKSNPGCALRAVTWPEIGLTTVSSESVLRVCTIWSICAGVLPNTVRASRAAL